MKIKDLRLINDLLLDLWDFFASNSDVDETGLNKEYVPKYEKVNSILSDEFYKLHLRSAKQKLKAEKNKISKK